MTISLTHVMLGSFSPNARYLIHLPELLQDKCLCGNENKNFPEKYVTLANIHQTRYLIKKVSERLSKYPTRKSFKHYVKCNDNYSA